MPSPWDNLPSLSGRYEEADEINTAYPKEGGRIWEIYDEHNVQDCEYDVFESTDYRYGREDEVDIKVFEEDPWPNPDDDVANWEDVVITVTGAYVHQTSSTAVGTPQHAQVTVFNYLPGKVIYND